MSVPYTSQAISGYNTSPPSDDGAATTANQVTWAKHKEKLADPIKTLVEAINTETLAAFGKIFGANVVTKSVDYTVLTTDQGQFLVMDTAAKTFTLPAVASAGTGFAIALMYTGASGSCTVDGNASETINGSTSLSLLPNDFMLLTCNGSAWTALGDIGNSVGTFVPTFNGFSADPSSPNVDWTVRNKIVTVQMRFTFGTSNDAAFQITNWPSAIQPNASLDVPVVAMVDGGATLTQWGVLNVGASANATFYSDAALGTWTASGNKGLSIGTGTVVSYPLLIP